MSLEHTLFGMCNPLLDISAEVSESLLEKYALSPASAIMAEEKHLPLYKELVENHQVEYIAGGSAQNALRVYQWMIQSPNSATFVGCVGNDDFGKQLRNSAEKDGLNAQYLIDPEIPTGTCAVLVVGKERTLVANLAAANAYKHDHLLTDAIQQYIQKAKYYYFSGFFLTVSPESILHVAKHAVETNKPLMINLSAQFIMNFFKDKLLSVLPYADFVFGNETEAREFSKVMGYETEDVAQIAAKISQYEKINSERKRIVIITQGADPVVIAVDGKTHTVAVPTVPRDLIKDTNGAGDAFVGGFLAGIVKGREIDDCVRAGIYSSGVVIQHSGCTYPEKPDYEL